MTVPEQPNFGPGFQGANSRLYRSEYALITAAIIGLFVLRYLYGLGGVRLLEIVLWAILPDLAAFVPIGLALKNGKWPAWGASLYNFFHTILVWTLVFVATWILLKTPHWELLGWLAHITTDRAVGFGLRQTKKSAP